MHVVAAIVRLVFKLGIGHELSGSKLIFIKYFSIQSNLQEEDTFGVRENCPYLTGVPFSGVQINMLTISKLSNKQILVNIVEFKVSVIRIDS